MSTFPQQGFLGKMATIEWEASQKSAAKNNEAATWVHHNIPVFQRVAQISYRQRKEKRRVNFVCFIGNSCEIGIAKSDSSSPWDTPPPTCQDIHSIKGRKPQPTAINLTIAF
jgi:hypothetical protein